MIQVLNGYRGRLTNEQFIPPGVYSEGDNLLFGLAGYLVQAGHAVIVPDVDMPISDEEAETLPDAETTEAKFGIENMTLTELKVLATRYQLEFNSRSTKAELIALIRNAEDTSDAEAD